MAHPEAQARQPALAADEKSDKTEPNLELQHAYEEYRREEVEHYIAPHYPAAQYEELVSQIEKRVQKQYRSAALWSAENLRDIAAGMLRQDISGKIDFVTFEQFSGTVANSATAE